MQELSRRNLFKTLGIGAATTFVASKSIANICEMSTASQPLGPFFPRPNTPFDPIRENQNPNLPIYLANDNDLTFVQGRGGRAKGQTVLIKGVVTDKQCVPVGEATIIIWQASASGRYNHKGDSDNPDFRHPKTGKVIQREHDPSFQYWGRVKTNAKGEYLFKTIIPGFYPADLNSEWYRPPHIHFMVMSMGREQFVTQMYFRGEEILENEWIQELNEKDFLLQNRSLSHAQREALVVNFKQKSGELSGEFNIQLP